jgi:mRNA interferase YafQ
MRRIRQQRRFLNDFKRQKRCGKEIADLFAVVELLAEGGELPAAYRAHRLSGEWKGLWECHIEPDWLLIYEVTDREVLLIRTGTHRDLFG